MIVRGELLGVLACGEKDNLETYAPDERATLGDLAHATGIAFDTIQTRALRDAVARVIAGDGDLEDLRRAQASSFG
jgi:GAF domain-containing protein